MRSGWRQDLRLSLRIAGQNPGPTALAVIAFGLGIGLTTAALSVVHGVILRGLPFDEAERIHALALATPDSPRRGLPVPAADFLEWRRHQQAFESLEAYVEADATLTRPGAYPERLRAARITPGTLRALRVPPRAGREFDAQDAAAGAPAVAIIGHDLWQSQFGGRDPIGTTLDIDGVPTVIVGVMPPSFAFPLSQQVWLPLPLASSPRRGMGLRINVFGRLKDGASAASAAMDLSRIDSSAEARGSGARVRVMPFTEQALGDDAVATLYTMMAAVIGVMLVACVNVASLLLMRGAERERDFAVRLALGAGPWPILRGTVVDALALAAGGAAAGLAFAMAATSIFGRAIAGTNPPFWIDVRPDLTIVSSAVGLTLAAALLASVAPAWRLTRIDVNRVLNDGGYSTTSLRAGRWFRALVVGEVAATCMLLIVAGVMVRGILRSGEASYPPAAGRVLYGFVTLEDRPGQPFLDPGEVNRLVERRLSEVPGARTVALASGLPHLGRTSAPVEIEGQPGDRTSAGPRAHRVVVSDTYFEIAGARLLSGRLFDVTDAQTGLAAAVVDEGFARRYLPDGAIGRRIRFGAETPGGVIFPASWTTVVGVVRGGTPERADRVETVYRPLSQSPLQSFAVLVATPLEPLSLGPDVRKAMAGIAGGTPIVQINTLAGHLWQQNWPARIFGSVFALFGAAALVLASVGLYGVVAFDVRQRTKEIGIRMALGAGRQRVLRMVLRQSLLRVSAGILIGLVPAWWIARWIVSAVPELLMGVSADDRFVYAVTAGVLTLSGVIASLAPTLRATSRDLSRTISGRA